MAKKGIVTTERSGGAGGAEPSIPLNRALSKLRILSRAQATVAIREGRVTVNGRVVTDPATVVAPERVQIRIDGEERPRHEWRTILLHKPRGVLTTRVDPEGRPTIFDRLGAGEQHLVAVGRLDLATSGLLLLTSDTQLANFVTDPVNAVPRVYAVTARGEVSDQEAARLKEGVGPASDRLSAHAVTIRKRSRRETHLLVELREGKNREVRRLFEAIGHELTKLKRVRLGGLELGDLPPGHWREVSRAEIEATIGLSGSRLPRSAAAYSRPQPYRLRKSARRRSRRQ